MEKQANQSTRSIRARVMSDVSSTRAKSFLGPIPTVQDSFQTSWDGLAAFSPSMQAVNIPVISPWLPTMIQQCCEFPHPNSLILKQSLEFPPAQGQRTHSIPLNSPTYPPGQPGGRPLGQADDMCITRMKNDHTSNSHYLTYWFFLDKVVRMYVLNLGVEGLRIRLTLILIN